MLSISSEPGTFEDRDNVRVSPGFLPLPLTLQNCSLHRCPK